MFAANPAIAEKHYEDQLLDASELPNTPAGLGEFGVEELDQEWVSRALGPASGSVVLLGDDNCGKVFLLPSALGVWSECFLHRLT